MTERKVIAAILGGLVLMAVSVCLYFAYFTPEQVAARHRLSEADTKSEAAIVERLSPVAKLFQKGRSGAKRFAEDALSWRGKFNALAGMVDGKSDREYLKELFYRHIFTPDELQAVMEGVVKAYLDDIERIEAEMLVHLRADMADPDRPLDTLPPHWRGDAELQRAYQQLFTKVAAEMNSELAVTVGREVAVVVGSEVATRIVLDALKVAGTEMGVSGGVLGAGASSTVTTLGVGLVVSIIIDYLLDAVLKVAGYDPVEDIQEVVTDSLNRMERALTHKGGFFSYYKKGSLRKHLEDLHAERSKVRRVTIARFLKEGTP